MLEEIEKMIPTGILPVIRLDDSRHAVPLAKALYSGGIPTIEVTLRSDSALESIRKIKTEFPAMAVGAGTVLSERLANQAMDAGADFLVSPGLNPKTVAYCLKKGAAIIPGAVTATDIELGMSLGLRVFKYFPAEQMGGLPAIQLLSGPFPQVKFIPTGGLGYPLLPGYLAKDFILACGGSYMAGGELIRQERWQEIQRLSRAAVKISMGFELAHIGINHENPKQAEDAASWFCSAFDFEAFDRGNAVFAGTAVESLKGKFSGTKGHIGFSTLSMSRAMAYLRAKGFRFREDSVVTGDDGKPKWAYFADEIYGFAVHIIQK